MLLEKLKYNFEKYKNNIAFCIEEVNYTYADFYRKIAAIQQKFNYLKIKPNDIVIVKTYNDIETYASIFAIWFYGATFVPINPTHPKKRNTLILKQIESKIIISSNPIDKEAISTKELEYLDQEIILNKFEDQHIMYILFTSGSTGIPKGVPISLNNITAFITDFSNEFTLNSRDKFLQIYDLTFDASIHCYLLPLFLGACVYTVSPKKVKYLEAYKLMDKHEITFAKFPPSVLSYLKPFFNKIKLPKLKYSLLGGEGLDFELVKLWQTCVKHTQIYNVYGPTEATVNSHIFNVSENLNSNKTYNGIVCIGKPFGNNKAIIVDKNNNTVLVNTKGELCLLGNQITNGYYKNKSKNESSFFIKNNMRFYKTGDLAYIDDGGDFIYCGRIDNQVQIQGYRVELSEIENIAKKTNKALNFSVVSKKNKYGVNELFLFSENLKIDNSTLQTYLKQNLPSYMLPKKIINLLKFPMTSSGKVDRQSLISKHL